MGDITPTEPQSGRFTYSASFHAPGPSGVPSPSPKAISSENHLAPLLSDIKSDLAGDSGFARFGGFVGATRLRRVVSWDLLAGTGAAVVLARPGPAAETGLLVIALTGIVVSALLLVLRPNRTDSLVQS